MDEGGAIAEGAGVNVEDQSLVGQEHELGHEQRRLAALRSLDLLGAPPEERFDRITRMACELFGVPSSFITLIDEDMQVIQSPMVAEDMALTPRSESFCDHTIRSPEMLVVPDATKDERFSSLPIVTGDKRIRFYAGQPISLGDDLRLGALCLVDTVPRELSAADRALLQDMARWVEREMRETAQWDRALDVQRSLFPLNRVGQDDYDLVGVCIPSRGVSGDFYDWYSIPGGVEFTLADVMGKGTGAAILASSLRTAFKISVGEGTAEAIQQVSDRTATDLEASNAFATLVHGRYDPVTGRLDYADAGHGLSIIVRTDGSVERLECTGLPVGVAPMVGWSHASVVLAPGDVLVSATDGVLDLFDGTLDSLTEVARFVTPESSAQDVADRVRVAAASGPKDADDVTVLVLRRHR
jgi:sigma-B regulation protein RsbU (phosphoserine phosphatase)